MDLGWLQSELGAVVRQGEKMPEDVRVSGIAADSRQVKPGDLFVCIRGSRADGHDFVEEAVAKGASAVLVEADRGTGKRGADATPVFAVADTREALAVGSALFFGRADRRLHLIGVTGTKGKTTTAWMVRSVLEAAGIKTGILGTLGADAGDGLKNIPNTTPGAFTIHQYFAKMVEMGCEYAVMEVSSQAVKEKRICGLEFDVGIFTNFGNDHIGPEEHADLEEYRDCKARFFTQCRDWVGNLDDGAFAAMFAQVPGPVKTYGCRSRDAQLRGEEICFFREKGRLGTAFTVEGQSCRLQMPGVFNVYNALAALQTAEALGIRREMAVKALEGVTVRGRMELVSIEKNIACYVDYAHNAMSLREALVTLRQYRSGRILVVFGCGGDRSGERRAAMGEVAGRFADYTILTSDNPRTEEAMGIISQIAEGVKQSGGAWSQAPDRQEAVNLAVEMARPGDMVLVAGKGHEEYQEIAGRRIPMDDRELLRLAWKKRKSNGCTQTL